MFKDATGLPPSRYVLHKRIEFACAALRRDELSIESVALACGFSDSAQFSKQFRKVGTPAKRVTPSSSATSRSVQSSSVMRHRLPSGRT
ncbi:helix-turn-helix domain-containing protein [Cupriavidus sp. KK10]|uniref:helix-turn-helix domain-containing protein n=1 Tax=Cupriavidus TaxID=106589 RepID=UPI003530539C